MTHLSGYESVAPLLSHIENLQELAKAARDIPLEHSSALAAFIGNSIIAKAGGEWEMCDGKIEVTVPAIGNIDVEPLALDAQEGSGWALEHLADLLDPPIG